MGETVKEGTPIPMDSYHKRQNKQKKDTKGKVVTKIGFVYFVVNLF